MSRNDEPWLERLPLLPDRPWISYPAALLLIALAYLVRVAAQGILPTGFPFVTFFPAVIVTSFLFGVGPGIAAGIAGGMFSYAFFIAPAENDHPGLMGLSAMFLYIVVVAVDIALVHLMQRANAKLAVERERSRALAEMREILFQELQHRVSNNLQVAGALLSLQRRTVDDDKARHALDEASRRLGLIGRISRSLYSGGTAKHRLEPFLKMLMEDIVKAHGRDDIAFTLTVRCDPELSSNVSIPMAIIITEAISNAIEHGFSDRDDAKLALTVSAASQDQIAIEIADNGCGLPPGFALEKCESLGLKIATSLAAQLKGSFDLVPGEGGGTVAHILLPA